MEQNNVKLTLSYDGTNYHGYQSQKKDNTVEEKLKKAVSIITKKEPVIYCSGRTDSGVHAEGQVVNFIIDKTKMNENNYLNAINSLLPHDIRVLNCEFVDMSFNSRTNCIAREYWYYINNSNRISALNYRFMAIYPFKLDTELLQLYCNELIGEHNFSSFCSTLDDSKTKNRSIYLAKIEKSNDIVIFKIIGNAFLHHMVRTITGTLLKLHKEKKPSSEIKFIIESQDRKLAGINYFAKGLIFKKAFYNENELKKACPDYKGIFYKKQYK